MKLGIVIPAYNEASAIEEVIRQLPSKLPRISEIIPIIIDDSSTDDTVATVKRIGARCLHHRLNLGQGGATMTGFQAARRLNCDVVVTLDGDGQHDPREIKKLIRPILRDNIDVVLGSRLLDKKAMPLAKRAVNSLATVVTFVFAGLWVSDSQSGYKAFSRRALSQVNLESVGYEFCTELIREVRVRGLRYTEVPIKTIYTEYSRKKGQLLWNSFNIVVSLLTRSILRPR